jgi:hypothetical protein
MSMDAPTAEQYEVTDLRRREDGVIEATVRYENGLTAVREVKSIEISATVHRGPESREQGLQDKDLGIVAASYRDGAREMLARKQGIGPVEVGGCV